MPALTQKDMIGRAIDLPQCVAECPVDTPYRIQDTPVLPDIARFLPGIDAEISHAHFIQHIVDILNDRPQVSVIVWKEPASSPISS